MANYTDTELEFCIDRIKTCKSSHNKLVNYRKANKRLELLKLEYNDLCKLLTVPDDNVIETNHNVEEIIEQLTELESDMSDTTSMTELVSIYVKSKMLLDQLVMNADDVKNEIYKVEQKHGGNGVKISKLDPDSLI